MILCALRTGMRLGEICALDWSDVNLDSRMITIRRSLVEGIIDSPKNNRIRSVPISDDLCVALMRRQQKGGFVFAHPDGNHMRKSSWPWKALRRACKRAGLPVIGWHPLRHTFASELTTQAIPMKATQMLLGHSSMQMTERYAHLSPSALSNAISVLPRATGEMVEDQQNVSYVSAAWLATPKK